MAVILSRPQCVKSLEGARCIKQSCKHIESGHLGNIKAVHSAAIVASLDKAGNENITSGFSIKSSSYRQAVNVFESRNGEMLTLVNDNVMVMPQATFRPQVQGFSPTVH